MTVSRPSAQIEPNGIYNATTTQIMALISQPPSFKEKWATDQNIFDWYQSVLPANLSEFQVIDWGAGVGRFVPLLQSRGPDQITLVEPSNQSLITLRETFGHLENIEIIKGPLGSIAPRVASPYKTVHVCNFVINCLPSLNEAFEHLATSVRPKERLFIATNIFVPKVSVSQISDQQFENSISFNFTESSKPALNHPKTTVFSNYILSTGATFKDAVHTQDEYSKLWHRVGRNWQILSSRLTLPDGFEHRISEGEDFGDFQFAVMLLELVRAEQE